MGWELYNDKLNEKKYRYKSSELKILLLGRKGGKTTIKVIEPLFERPYNINQLSKHLRLDYNTIKYHVNIMLSHNYLIKDGESYGSLYQPSKKLIKEINEYNQIKEWIKKDIEDKNDK